MAREARGEPGPKYGLPRKHRTMLRDVFEKPTRGGLEWRSIEALFAALGATMSEGRGSRVRVFLNGRVAVFHRPHPQKETSKGAVEAARDFLTNAGFEP